MLIYQQLAHFLADKPLFGPSGSNIRIESKSDETVRAAWSIARIMWLLGEVSWDEIGEAKYRGVFELARMLVERGFVQGKASEDELTGLGVSRDCVQIVLFLLALDPGRRPTVAQALGHSWLA